MSDFAVHEPKFRVVTPAQFSEGYREMRWHPSASCYEVWRRRFVKVRTLEDGNVLVREPTPCE